MPVPEIFPFAFEVMGAWNDSTTLRRKTWVRCFSTDQEGRQVGRAWSRLFDSVELLLFECRREFRTAILEPRRERFAGILLEAEGHWDRCCGYWFCVHDENLTHEDRLRIAEIVQSRTEEENK